MRRLNRLVHEDRGASAVIVALLLVPLLGLAAVGVDAGSMYWEESQLQNGADAAAIAVAQTCARTSNACTGYAGVAGTLAAGNANDAAANYQVAFPNGMAGGKVVVATSTRNADGTTTYSHPLISAVQSLVSGTSTPTTEGAQATAIWGSPTQGALVLPLTVSLCDFTPALDGSKVLIQYANKNSRVTCAKGTSYPPGGFGWLDNVSCVATVQDGAAPGDPGNSYPGSCDSVLTSAVIGQTLLIPIFDSVVAASGNNGQDSYEIYGFAAFVLTGWRFSGGSTLPQNHADPTMTGALACTGSCRGIQGYFTHFVSLDSVGTTLGGPSLGASVVELIK